MSAEQVALIPRCAECEAAWLPADEERWRAYLGADSLDEPAEVVFYCPTAQSESLAMINQPAPAPVFRTG